MQMQQLFAGNLASEVCAYVCVCVCVYVCVYCVYNVFVLCVYLCLMCLRVYMDKPHIHLSLLCIDVIVYVHEHTCAKCLLAPPSSLPLLPPLLHPSSTPASSSSVLSLLPSPPPYSPCPPPLPLPPPLPSPPQSQALTRSPFGSGPLPIIVGCVYCTGNEAQFANHSLCPLQQQHFSRCSLCV